MLKTQSAMKQATTASNVLRTQTAMTIISAQLTPAIQPMCVSIQTLPGTPLALTEPSVTEKNVVTTTASANQENRLVDPEPPATNGHSNANPALAREVVTVEEKAEATTTAIIKASAEEAVVE